MKLLAAAGTPIGIGNIGGEGLGPFGNTPATSGPAAVDQITKVVSSFVGLLTIIASIWFLFQLLFGGYEWISSGGDAKRLVTARERILNGFIGLIIVIAAWAIVALVGEFLGYDILNPKTYIGNLQL
jgi:hypothetical protein